MKRWLLTIVFAAVCVVRVAADLTLTTTTTVEGGMAAAAGSGVVPKVVTRIKGNKSRTDVETGEQRLSMLVDLTTRQVIVLRADEKTARVIEPAVPPSNFPAALPTIESTITPTGQSREIDGAKCDEYAVSIRMNMASMASADTPPQAAEMLKGLRMNMAGSAWVAKDAPGAAEYAAFQAAAGKIAVGSLAGVAGKGSIPGLPPGMERLFAGFAEAPGIPYLTELTMAMEGESQLVAVMKQMGTMKIISRTTAVSTDTLPDSLFAIPDGYTLVKQ